eukprot:1586362-Alexandrium_andersonii.AAC.1
MRSWRGPKPAPQERTAACACSRTSCATRARAASHALLLANQWGIRFRSAIPEDRYKRAHTE